MFLVTIAAGIGIEENLKQFILVLLVSLSVATLSQSVSWFRQIPYTLLLVIAGLGLAFIDVRLVNLSPPLILFIFLPPLLFEAAWNMQWPALKRDLVPISIYAVFGVVISVAGTALALWQLAGISLATALLIGASVSATDPVSVIALFRELGVEKRLSMLMEGESLFNDGIAVVAFTFLVGFSFGTTEFTIQSLIVEFLTFVGIGIGVGIFIGFGISYLTQRFDLPFVEQSITLISAYGAYLVAEDLGGSGVIAVVITGLILGNFGSRIGMNPRTRVVVTEFWEFVAFFLNSIVFLLIGDQISFAGLGENLGSIAIAIAAVILTRALAIYGLGGLCNWLAKSEISLPDQTVLWWGGLRGSVSIALALSIPTGLPNREATIAIVFGVVLFTLLVQGVTTKTLLEKLGLLSDRTQRQEYLEAIARRVTINRILNHLSQAAISPEIEPEYYQQLTDRLQEQLDSVQKEIDQLYARHPQIQEFTVDQLQKDLVAIEDDTYAEFVRKGWLNESPSSLLDDVFKQESAIPAEGK
ncbi:cation:proton antiporter [Argonema galeatum]|uniref:cation:proton antiporter n=1 Tax=Argonema galeatum TaxID=2942762 RepID=UPI00201336FC|nr:sodium:proton antiporter [Argonema galeatum]MCL1463827.1 sodium:proton antiporter [Argonema galeatum A003/A1]